MSGRLRRAFDNALERARRRSIIQATVGKRLPDGTYQFLVDGKRDSVWVTMRLSSGGQTTVPAVNTAGVPHRARLAVEIRKEGEIYVILRKSASRVLSTPEASDPSGNEPHLHSHGSMDGLEEDSHPQYMNEGRGDERYVSLTEDQEVDGLKIFTALLTALSLESPILSGGDAANEDLTLQGTSHATRTTSYVLIQPTAGHTAVGPGTPTVALHVFGNFAVQDTNIFSIVPNYPGAGDIPPGVLFSANASYGFLPGSQSGSNANLLALLAKTGSSTWRSMVEMANVSSGSPFLQLVKTAGQVLIGSGVTPATASTRALMHKHNGVHGWADVSVSGIVGNALTIVPDGTGDVTLWVRIVGGCSNAVPQVSTVDVFIAPGGTADITVDGGTNTLRFAVSAGGALTVIRQAGASTWEFGGYITWR